MLVLEYATIEYNYWGVEIRDPNPNATITHSTIQHIATCGICLGFDPIKTGPIIEGNTFRDCRHEAVDTHANQNIIIRNNLFEDNLVGIVANDGSTVLIENNHFIGNERGIS